MKKIILKILDGAMKSFDNDSLLENVKSGFIELYSMESHPVLEANRSKVIPIVNDLLNKTEFSKLKKDIVTFSNMLMRDFEASERPLMKPLVEIKGAKDKNLETNMNKVLDIFHKITKTHENGLNRNGSTPLEVRALSSKENAILNLIKDKMGEEEFNKIGISWNPYIGLFIPSKEGFEANNQVLMMSHIDLIPTFEKLHRQVENRELESAISINTVDEVDDKTIIAGSLDNTMVNAVLLNNLLGDKFDGNVNVLFETDEESGMRGSRSFHREEMGDFWVKVDFKDGEVELSKSKKPMIKKDLIVVNTDVTMGYEESVAIETRNFSKSTNKELLTKFPILAQQEYSPDDSTSTVGKNPAFSFCVNVGTSIVKLENGKTKFSGSCHSLNTYSSVGNILDYNELMPELVNAIGKSIKLEMKGHKPKQIELESSFIKEKDYLIEGLFESIEYIYDLENYNNLTKDIKIDVFEELKGFAKGLDQETTINIKNVEGLKEMFSKVITNEEIKEGLEMFVGESGNNRKQELIHEYLVELLEERFHYQGDSDFYEVDTLDKDEKLSLLNILRDTFEDLELEELVGDLHTLSIELSNREHSMNIDDNFEDMN